ncbi:LEA type 2 family protein [Granulosicoccus antarcticus]|uniref:Water stress and hypersensitive response domain-containing protein n=1 Tax=Granulosicoccus antarcticus IMCC3135 TaxID=1192854 RepID=A0A2Z2NVF7_9GAMM|nr:LEA type 2 family protein [Granulosicoccus antarcticus]ASJ71124.1 hypothetical protein IMCC3135_05055 [Granulosicoccus antarcticus IMCC3135]
MQYRSAAACLLAVSCLLLSACNTMLTSRPIAPTVEVTSVKAEKIGLIKQDLMFQLMVSNPNDYDLPVQALSFIAAVDGVEMAQGMSTERVLIPANNKARLDIQVSTRMNKLLGQLLLATSKSRKDLAYDVKGFVKLSNWPLRIPFNVDGAVENPVQR